MTPPPYSLTRRRLPIWAGILALVLLVPAIAIPTVLSLFSEPAFQSIDEVDPTQVHSIELFILQRPDGGEDIGSTKQLYAVPATEFDRVLGCLRQAERVEAVSPRGVWLGRMIVRLSNGQRQTVMFHRPRTEGDAVAMQRLEIRIGRNQFRGPNVNEFTQLLGGIAGVDVKRSGD